MRCFRVVAAGLSLCLAVGCSSGNSSGGGSEPSPDYSPSCCGQGEEHTGVASPPTWRVSGTVLVSRGAVADNDSNNPFDSYLSNDTAETAQVGPNPGVVQGFLSATGFGPVNSRFATVGDVFDTYRIQLAAGQVVSVEVSAWQQSSPLAEDIDLFLYDVNRDPVQSSEGVAAVEAFRVETSGEYYVVLQSISGASNYTLRISSGEGAVPGDRNALSQFSAFYTGEAVVGYDAVDTSQARLSVRKMIDSTALDTARHPVAKRVVLGSALSTLSSARSRAAVMHDGWSGKTMGASRQGKIATIQGIKALIAQPGVRYAEPNYTVMAHAVPNDPQYSYQWHFPAIDLPSAWDITQGATGGDPVIVAVLDSGIRFDHPDLAGQTTPGFDFVSGLGHAGDGDGIDGDPTDPGSGETWGASNWHGSHVAGTVAARSNNQLGLAGVAPRAKIMPIRVLGKLVEVSSGIWSEGSAADIVQGILYAAGLPNASGQLPSQRADIINMSLGSPSESTAITNAISDARSNNVVVVVSAGNNDGKAAPMVPLYPASSVGVISVGASTITDKKAWYSYYGETVDVAAPGGELGVDINHDGEDDAVISTVMEVVNGSLVAAYLPMQGTSMAAPHVAGVLALMKAVHPGLTPDQVDGLLAAGQLTDDLGEPGRDNSFGHGRINAYKSVLAAQALAGLNGGVAARLLASPSRLDFGRVYDKFPLRLEASGGSVSGISVSAPVDWIAISDATSNGNGMEYTVSVVRAGLAPGVHHTHLIVNSSAGLTELPITLDTSSLDTAGDAGRVYFLLYDVNKGEVLQTAAQAVDGRYAFAFDAVATGEYVLIAGSDHDNNNLLCGAGEGCGAWPSLAEPEVISVQGHRSDVDFSLDKRSGLQRFTPGSYFFESDTALFQVDKSKELVFRK